MDDARLDLHGELASAAHVGTGRFTVGQLEYPTVEGTGDPTAVDDPLRQRTPAVWTAILEGKERPGRAAENRDGAPAVSNGPSTATRKIAHGGHRQAQRVAVHS